MSEQAFHPGKGHRQRLRDKFLNHGLDKFTDDEVLELLLTLATPRKDCKQQARALLESFGALGKVLDASSEELSCIKGLGPKNILGLKLVPAVAQRYLEDRLVHGVKLSSACEAEDYLRFTMRGLTNEVFRVIYLDLGQRVKAVEDLSNGTLDQAVVYPRELVKRALTLGAGSVICAHNHPTGDVRPSRDDHELTRRIYYALRACDIKLLDHLVVACDDLYSFAEQGLIQSLGREYNTLNL